MYLKDIKSKIKKIMVVSVIALTSCLMSSCANGQKLFEFANTDIRAAIMDRIQANRSLAEELKEAGFISESTLKATLENLNKMEEAYNSDKLQIEVNNDGKMTKSGFTSAISYWRPLGGYSRVGKPNSAGGYTWYTCYSTPSAVTKDDGTVESPVLRPSESCGCNYTSLADADNNVCAKLDQYVVSNYISGRMGWNTNTHCQFTKDADGKPVVNQWWHWENEGRMVDPIVLIDTKMSSEINEKFGFELYVLSPTVFDSVSIDGIVELASTQIQRNSNGEVISIGKLGNYFTPVLDENNKPVTLLDMTDISNMIVRDSIQNPATNNDKHGIDPKEPGYDMLVTQFGSSATDDSGEPVLAVRFTEFNAAGIRSLKNILGINSNQYIFASQNGVNRVYLMEYPVYTLGELEDFDRSGGDTEWRLTKSGIGINLMTGKLIKYEPNGSGGWLANGKEITEDSKDMYLTVTGADNENSTGKASFIVKGVGTTTLKRSLFTSNSDITVATGKIILRDYLEATYAPQYDSDGDEDITVFGRKIRINFSDWKETKVTINNKDYKDYIPVFKKGTDMAFFIDAKGDQIVNSPKLQITDFCSYEKLMLSENNRKVTRLNYIGEKEEWTPAPVKANEKENRDISELAVDTAKSIIKPVMMFPSTLIGQSDYATDTEQKQRFYCLVTTKGLFDSGLFSSWIESSSTTASLDWWNKYLSNNGFAYSISHEDLNSWLSGNYAYQLSQNGVIILDLDTVAKIQDMYDEDSDYRQIRGLRTVFVVLGWGLVMSGMLLMLLWTIDTNMDLGFALVEKITLGHWIAVKYDSDIPSHNPSGQTYLTCPKMFIRCMCVIALGLLLIRVNAFEIVTLLIKVFGGFGSIIEKVVKGIY